MTKSGRMSTGSLSRGMIAASLLGFGLAAAAGAFFFGLDGSLTSAARVDDFSSALLWAQALAIAALSLLAVLLLALGLMLRAQLYQPLEALRRSLISAAAGGMSEPISGLRRSDEIGALARAVERLRQSVATNEQNEALILGQAIERLIKEAGRLEADFAKLASATSRATEKIEEASVRVVKASHTAIEAAGLTRDGAQRMATQAGDRIDALIETATRLSAAMARTQYADEAALPNDNSAPASGVATDEEAASVLEGLVGDLDALERFARRRNTIESEEAVVLNAALIEAIDRLNAVAQRIAAAADQSAKHAAE